MVHRRHLPDFIQDLTVSGICWCLSLAVVLILIGCAYGIDELNDSVIIVVVFCLAIAHPGPLFAKVESERMINVDEEPKV
ncbi:hypothetical protein ABVK25_008885 [Lepraria finkii]|uniref:Uncharacterized protein n=1 Tax=Lepraria finkii TaxID=1340010 RepID=A0ABR4B1Q0_9LECA